MQVWVAGLSVIANGGLSTTVCTGFPARSQGGNINFCVQTSDGSATALVYIMEDGTMKYNSTITSNVYGTVTYNIE